MSFKNLQNAKIIATQTVSSQTPGHLINSPSLPLGIIKDSEVSNGNGTVSSGDVIIMVSDGVNNEDLILVEKELRCFNNENIRAFAENLSEKIREYQNDKNDDLTLITLLLNKNE